MTENNYLQFAFSFNNMPIIMYTNDNNIRQSLLISR